MEIPLERYKINGFQLVTVFQYHFEILNVIFQPKVKKTLPNSAKTAYARVNDRIPCVVGNDDMMTSSSCNKMGPKKVTTNNIFRFCCI